MTGLTGQSLQLAVLGTQSFWTGISVSLGILHLILSLPVSVLTPHECVWQSGNLRCVAVLLSLRGADGSCLLGQPGFEVDLA
jgi:hypothetical protein